MTTAIATDKQSEIAKTILQQLGGGKFTAMTGAKGFMSIPEGGLVFQLPGKSGYGKNGINSVRIVLNQRDLYNVEFIKTGTRRNDFQNKTIEAVNDLFYDQLQEVFTRVTGLYTRI